MRQCGECTLCCKLLPVHGGWRVDGKDLPGNFHKPAGQRCPHQRFKKGCAVYGKPQMPPACTMWNCRWLVGDDTADLPRPDRSHYVIDTMPDFITVTHQDTGESFRLQVVQVWVDPAHRDAHRDPALREYLMRRAGEGIAAIIRHGSHEGFVLMAPPFTGGGWHEVSGASEREHTAAELAAFLEGGNP